MTIAKSIEFEANFSQTRAIIDPALFGHHLWQSLGRQQATETGTHSQSSRFDIFLKLVLTKCFMNILRICLDSS